MPIDANKVAEEAYSAGNLVTNDGYYEFDLEAAATVIQCAFAEELAGMRDSIINTPETSELIDKALGNPPMTNSDIDALCERLDLAQGYVPARAEWFEAVTCVADGEVTPEHYRAMLLCDDEPGCSSILAQMMLDQNALDIADIINAAHEARATILALRDRLEKAEGALREAQSVLELVRHPAFRDPVHSDEIEALGDRIGYGALMSGASAIWRSKAGVRGGEFVAGPCHATVVRTLDQIDAYFAAQEPTP